MEFFKISRSVAVCIAAAFLLTACSTTVPQVSGRDEGAFQTISVNTPGMEEAHCFVQVEGMSYPVATPGKVMVKRAHTPMNVTCFKGEHLIGTQSISPVCSNCGYPQSVSVAMSLDTDSLERKVRQFR